MANHLLGRGVLTWHATERRTDRYGYVYLTPTPASEFAVKLHKAAHGQGSLVAIVEETRPSQHIGDLAHQVFPRAQTVGTRIVLGKGELVFDNMGVGIRPTDGRTKLCLDIRALYDAHDQTVSLYFEDERSN